MGIVAKVVGVLYCCCVNLVSLHKNDFHVACSAYMYMFSPSGCTFAVACVRGRSSYLLTYFLEGPKNKNNAIY